jgi:hypothetical protein
MTKRNPRCEHLKGDGQRCEASALGGSRWCFFHDPAKAEQRTAARRAGGTATRAIVLPADAPNVMIESAADVRRLLAETISQVRRGDLDPRVANCVGYLAGQVLTAFEKDELEQRIAQLERRVTHQPRLLG